MSKIYTVWSVVYKEEGNSPVSLTYNSETEAEFNKLMIEDSYSDGIYELKLEWIYLIEGNFIEI